MKSQIFDNYAISMHRCSPVLDKLGNSSLQIKVKAIEHSMYVSGFSYALGASISAIRLVLCGYRWVQMCTAVRTKWTTS